MSETNKLLKIIILILVVVFFPTIGMLLSAYVLLIVIPLFLIVYIAIKLPKNKEITSNSYRTRLLNLIFKVPFIAKVQNASGMEIYDGGTGGPYRMDGKPFTSASNGLQIRIEYVIAEEYSDGRERYFGRFLSEDKFKWILLDSHVLIDASQDQINALVKDYCNRDIKCVPSDLPFYDRDKVSNAINQIYPPKRFKGYNPRSVYNWIIVHNWGETSITAPNEETALRNFSRTYPNCRVMSVNKEVK